MKKWWGTQPLERSEFESQQQKLSRMSAEVVRRYQKEIGAEVNDATRLAAVYGSGFASGSARKQAGVVCLMASSMLKVPNTDVTLVWPDRQEAVASVRDHVLAGDEPVTGAYTDSFCKFVIGTGRELSVREAQVHPLVCDTTFATAGTIVAYLGVPIANRDGIIVGVLCVHDTVTRDWTAADVSMLTQLSVVLTRAMDPVPAA